MNKVAVVSGATSALGVAVCDRLAKEGFHVARFSRTSEAFPCNVTSQAECDDQMKKVVSSMGSVSVLVNCAGINSDKLLLRTNNDDFTSLYATNVIGSMNTIRSALKHGGMLKARHGSIVNIGSVVGVYGNSGQSSYAASKAALIGASLSIAKEYSTASIRCNVVCPGLIENTTMWEALTEQQRSKLVSTSLLQRCGTVDEVADSIYFLCNNSYVNGHVLMMDGGR
eukprot:GILI01014074.1.p1 GENE.GILI01014074.1~~GILI01014074.1.p1  ORF type:complete len:236 (+),score=27.56 GILI01014074.1:32-709(+)